MVEYRALVVKYWAVWYSIRHLGYSIGLAKESCDISATFLPYFRSVAMV